MINKNAVYKWVVKESPFLMCLIVAPILLPHGWAPFIAACIAIGVVNVTGFIEGLTRQ